MAGGTDDERVTVETPVAFEGHLIEPPSQVVETSKREIIDMFTQAYMMRRLEIAADVLYKGKFIRGFCHLYDGQEAVVVGMETVLTKDDAVVTSYRDHCVHLGRGGTPLEVMAELMGRVDGAAKGIGGSMHMYRREANFFGGNGIVGAQTPILFKPFWLVVASALGANLDEQLVEPRSQRRGVGDRRLADGGRGAPRDIGRYREV